MDYPPELYSQYQDEADAELEKALTDLLEAGKRDIVLDRSLYSKEDRDYFKKLVDAKGGRWILIFLRPASKDVLWSRIQQRREAGVNADSALDITREILSQFWDGFEKPRGEGEVVVDVVG